jgi:hypothetical protein
MKWTRLLVDELLREEFRQAANWNIVWSAIPFERLVVQKHDAKYYVSYPLESYRLYDDTAHGPYDTLQKAKAVCIVLERCAPIRFEDD